MKGFIDVFFYCRNVIRRFPTVEFFCILSLIVPKRWSSLYYFLFVYTALCGGFEKYDILEDMGFSARNRRKLSQGTEPRPNLENMIRRDSLTETQGEETLISTLSDSELQQSANYPTEGYKRSLSEGIITIKKDSVKTKMIRAPKSHSLELDVSSFDFSELRSSSLCSTELWQCTERSWSFKTAKLIMDKSEQSYSYLC